MDKQCASYCMALIRCLLRNEAVPDIPEGVSLENLYAFAKFHGVEAMVYHGLEPLLGETQNPVWQTWTDRTNMLLTQSIIQLAQRDMLMTILPAEGIRILPVKGCWLKEQYPEIDYRQMSDLDILIDPDNGEKAKRIMLEQGYVLETGPSDHHDSYAKAPYLSVELHQALLPEEDVNASYYGDVWKKAVPVQGFSGVFQMTPEDAYIYYILHLYKHFQHSGTGIRSILDCVVYRDVYPAMNRSYLERELRGLGLWELVVQVEALSDCWFRTGEPVPQQLEALADSVLSAGTYGKMDNYIQLRMTQLEQKYKNPTIRGLAYWWVRVFRPRKEMARIYPVLNKLPFLLPVFWIHRAAEKLITRPKEMLRQIRLVFRGEDTYGKD